MSLVFLADPATILSCVAIDAVGLVQVTKGNIRVFCTMAERFMDCFKPKTRGCIGEEVNQRTKTMNRFQRKSLLFHSVCARFVVGID